MKQLSLRWVVYLNSRMVIPQFIFVKRRRNSTSNPGLKKVTPALWAWKVHSRPAGIGIFCPVGLVSVTIFAWVIMDLQGMYKGIPTKLKMSMSYHVNHFQVRNLLFQGSVLQAPLYKCNSTGTKTSIKSPKTLGISSNWCTLIYLYIHIYDIWYRYIIHNIYIYIICIYFSQLLPVRAFQK